MLIFFSSQLKLKKLVKPIWKNENETPFLLFQLTSDDSTLKRYLCKFLIFFGSHLDLFFANSYTPHDLAFCVGWFLVCLRFWVLFDLWENDEKTNEPFDFWMMPSKANTDFALKGGQYWFFFSFNFWMIPIEANTSWWRLSLVYFSKNYAQFLSI